MCDLPLTGKIHAESHYMGKNHRKYVNRIITMEDICAIGFSIHFRALSGHKLPAGLGYYDALGKWVRTS